MPQTSNAIDPLQQEADADLQEQQARSRAQAQARANLDQAQTQSPDEAAGVLRDSDQLGIPPSIVGASPLARQHAQAARDEQTTQASPMLREFIASGGAEQAAASKDDLDVLGSMEQTWRGIQNAFSPAAMRQLQVSRDARFAAAGAQIDQALSPTGRAQAVQEVSRDAQQLATNMRNPQWWRQQADAAKTSALALGESAKRLVAGATQDIQTQPAVGARQQEIADLGWRAIDPAGAGVSSADLDRLDQLQSTRSVAPNTPVGVVIGQLPLILQAVGEGGKYATQGGAEGFTLGAGAALIGGQMGPQAATPEEVGTVPALAIAGFGLGARTGFTYGNALEMGRQQAGLAFAEFRQMKDESGRPLDPRIARIAALSVGAANGLLSTVELRTFVRAVPGGEQLLNGLTTDRMRALLTQRTFRDALLRAVGSTAYTTVVAGLTTAAMEGVQIAGEDLARDADGGTFDRPTFSENAQRIIQAGVGGAQAGFVFGTGGSALGLAFDLPRVRAAQQDADLIHSLATTSEQSKLRQRLPERFHAWVDSITRDGPLDTIWVDAHRFRQFYQESGVDPAAVADALKGVGREKYEQALAAHDDIPVPIPTFATQIAGTPAYAGLRDYMRLHPDADNLAEARNRMANEDTVAARIAEITKAETTHGDDQEAEQLIAGDMRRRLDVAGVTVTDANAMQSEAIAHAIMVLAAKGNENPVELYRRYWADIRGPFEDLGQIETQVSRDMGQAGPLDLEAFSRGAAAKHGLGDLRITQRADGDLTLDVLGVAKKNQKSGRGSAAMADITAFADQHGLRIRANPPKRGGAFGTTSQARSRAFLERHGFVENKGKSKDDAISEQMYRKPTGQRRVDQSENPTGTPRFAARAVPRTEGGIASPIPELGTPDFTLLLEHAVAKREAGQPLSHLEQYALNRVAEHAKGDVRSREYFSQDGETPRAGPTPARRGGRASIPAARGTERDINVPAHADLPKLLAEREQINRQIEDRMKSGERDTPAAQEARRDAEALRQAAYCAAREQARDIATARLVGGTLAGAAVATTVSASSDTANDAAGARTASTPAPQHPEGQIEAGNIDLHHRPVVQNADGSISTVRSITITDDNGRATLIPTVVGSRVVSNLAAIQHYRQTGEHLGIFDNEQHADAYAESLHGQQATEYAGRRPARPARHVRLPATSPETALSMLPADQAAAAQTGEEAAETTPDSEVREPAPDEPIITNHHAKGAR